MKEQTYKQFVESNRWFRERPDERKSYISKVSRLANSIQKDIAEGAAMSLLTFDEQNVILEAAGILRRIKMSLDYAKDHVRVRNKQCEYQVVVVHRHQYISLINERLSIDEENLVDVCLATMVIKYIRASNIIAAERYARLIEVCIHKKKSTTEELAKLIIEKYLEERDQLAYKFYCGNTETINYEKVKKSLETFGQKQDDVVKLYSTFFTKLAEALAH